MQEPGQPGDAFTANPEGGEAGLPEEPSPASQVGRRAVATRSYAPSTAQEIERQGKPWGKITGAEASQAPGQPGARQAFAARGAGLRGDPEVGCWQLRKTKTPGQPGASRPEGRNTLETGQPGEGVKKRCKRAILRGEPESRDGQR